jgi:hypothetical protein
MLGSVQKKCPGNLARPPGWTPLEGFVSGAWQDHASESCPIAAEIHLSHGLTKVIVVVNKWN